MKNKYLQEIERGLTPVALITEASRCLLCHDALCSKACPAGTDPAKFIRSVRFHNLKGAAETIRENNALGSVCARVCPTKRLCQDGCARSGIDRPIEIGKIQRYVTDYEHLINMKILKAPEQNGKTVAIVGSGPSGLQASATLSLLGYKVDVYEKDEQIGGYLRYGIPEYRLPSDVLDQDIKLIKDLGVTFITNHEINDLKPLKEKYDAVLLATGTCLGKLLPLFENNPYVDVAVNVLKDIRKNKGEYPRLKDALVVGGGDVAMDVATSLKLIGVENVTVVAAEVMKNFVASRKEFIEAQEQHVSIIDGYIPEKVEGNVVTFKHTSMEATLTLKADKIILATGQKSKLEAFDEITTVDGVVNVDKYQTADKKIFATGDIIGKQKIVVAAVKYGKEAASAIDAYLKEAK